MSEWQPIKTAPTETPIIIYDGEMICCAEKQFLWEGHEGYWYCVGAKGYEWDNSFKSPTHWMPLPDKPE